MTIRTDFTVATFVGFVCILAIFSRQINYVSDQGLIGLVISRTFAITFFISFFLKSVIFFYFLMKAFRSRIGDELSWKGSGIY